MKTIHHILGYLSLLFVLLWVDSAISATLAITPPPTGGTVTSQPAGINCGTTGKVCSKSVSSGSQISLTAQADPGFAFINWTLGGVSSAVNPLVRPMPLTDTSISATFSPFYNLTVSARSIGNGSGNVSSTEIGNQGAISCGTDIKQSIFCSSQYLENRVVTLTAKPDLYSVFAGWSGACSGKSPSCTITMNSASTAIAHFVQGDLTAVINPTWRKTAPLAPDGTDMLVTALAVSPHDHFTVYAGSYNGNIMKSSDGGMNWNLVNSGLPNATIKHIAFDPSNPQIIYAGTSRGMHKSSDGGVTWPAINNGVGTTSYEVLSFGVSKSDPHILFMGILGINYYLLKSIDGGANWTPTSLVKQVDSIQIVPDNSQIIYIVANESVMKSSDGGLSWTVANAGLEQSRIIRIIMVPSLPQQMYAEDSRGNIFSTSNGGVSWTPTGTITGLYGNPGFIIDPQNPHAMYAGTYNAAAGSTDGGTNWSFLTNILQIGQNVAVALDSEHHLLYVGANGVYKGERDINAILESDALTWTHSGSASWFSQHVTTHDGIDAMQSGAIGAGRSSSLSTTVTGPGTLTFWWKISSDPGDRLRLYVDGVVPTETVGISGEVDWTQISVHLSDGVHTLEWAYSKDAAVAAGSDSAWLDQVSYTRDPVNGFCGYRNAAEVTSIPTTSLCLDGTPTTVTYDSVSQTWKWGCDGSFGGTNASCSAFMMVPFSVLIQGEMGTITSFPSGINCINNQVSNCSAYFKAGTTVKLSATPAWYTTFGGWIYYQDTVWINYNDYPVMDFTISWPTNQEPYYSRFFGKNNVRIFGNPNLYSRIFDAYTAVTAPPIGAPETVIQVQSGEYLENLIFSSPYAVYLEGGKDSLFNPGTGLSTIKSLTIKDGIVKIKDFVLR